MEVKTRPGRARKLSDNAVQFAVPKDKANRLEGLADGARRVDA